MTYAAIETNKQYINGSNVQVTRSKEEKKENQAMTKCGLGFEFQAH